MGGTSLALGCSKPFSSRFGACWDHPTAPLSPLPLLGSPKYYKMVPGEGMPLAQAPQHKGDLYIYFDILFPKRLSPEVKKVLKSILQS